MKLKKVLAGVLATSTVLTLAGCGGSGSNSRGSKPAGNSGASSNAASNATSNTTSGGASSGGNSETTSGGDSDVWFDPSIKGIKVDESKIKPGMTLTVLSNRTDRVAGTGNGYFEEFVKPFEEHYGVTVKIEADSDQNALKQKITSNLKGCADVMYFPSFSPKKAAEYFEPLGTVGELSNYIDITNKALGDGDDAVVYGVPLGINAGGYVYNKKMWDAAGITEAPGNVTDFIADLKIIEEKTDAVPTLCCYTPKEQFVLSQIVLLGPAATGDPNYKTKLLVNGGDLFVEGEMYYEMARLIYEVYSNDDLHEPGASADWQQCKALVGNDTVATCLVGQWAVVQFKNGYLDERRTEAGFVDGDGKPIPGDADFEAEIAEEAKKISLNPAPYTAPDGKRYASVGADYLWAVNNTIADDQKELAKAFIKWWVEKSPFMKDEGYIPVLNTATIEDYPDSLKSWAGVEFFSNAQAPGPISSTWDDIDKASDVGIEADPNGSNWKNKVAELALAHGTEEEFKAILKECNEKWRLAREADTKLQEFIKTDEAKAYVDEAFAKKANF